MDDSKHKGNRTGVEGGGGGEGVMEKGVAVIEGGQAVTEEGVVVRRVLSISLTLARRYVSILKYIVQQLSSQHFVRTDA